jgi:predicted nuclease of predicted toxin-antitoxin system
MKILIDMNLSPDWVRALAAENIQAVHWSNVGDPRAEDAKIIEYARANDYIIFTHDLDFGTILSLTHATGPSVIQVRAQDVLPSHLSQIVIGVLRDNDSLLKSGALIVVDETRARVRVLPLERSN